MRHFASLFMCFWTIILSLQGQVQSGQVDITPTSYIKSSVEQKMEKWLQKTSSESVNNYMDRVSEANKVTVRNQFETEATAQYKELFTRNTNWKHLQIGSYNHDEQAFLIKSEVCADFMMPVPSASAAAFEAEFKTFQISNPDFYFEGDIVKFSKLTFTNSKKQTYTYDVTNNPGLARITWLLPLSPSQDTNEENLKIQACVKSESQITSVSVLVNGQIRRGISAVVNDGCDFAINKSIPLAKGMNELKIVVENKVGKSVSDVRYVNYQSVDNVTSCRAPKRLALVIGNAAYPHSPLVNPINDATDIAAKLGSLGFDVMLLTDNTKEQMERGIDKFGTKAKGYDVAMFFYAGHAIQYNGKNYLMPVNTPLLNGEEEEWKIEYDCTPVDRVLTNMKYSKCKLKLVVLDACRNNLFRCFDDGLSPMVAPTGTFISYSTSPNEKALDGIGRNSPYTAELLKRIDTKQLKIEDMFKQVREGVSERTKGQQLPWDQSSIIGEFYFNY